MSLLGTSPKQVSDVVLYEEPTARYSRSYGTASAAVEIGTVLKSDGAGGYEPILDDEGALAVGVSIRAAAASERIVFLDTHAVVREDGLVGDYSITVDRDNMIAGLLALGIKVRS